MSFELPEEYLNRCEPINKDDLQKSFEGRDIEIADLKEEVNKIAFARGELEIELNREKALNKVYEDNNRQLREMIEKMECCIVSCCEGCERLSKLYEAFDKEIKEK